MIQEMRELETGTLAPRAKTHQEIIQRMRKRRLTPHRRNMLLTAGALGVVSAGLLAAAPELGIASAFVSAGAAGASAITSLLARR